MTNPSSMSSHVVSDDLEQEQAYVDHAFACLEASKGAARQLRSTVESGKGGTHQARYERDVIEERVQRRLGRMELGDRSLCFGRIDMACGVGGAGSGEVGYGGASSDGASSGGASSDGDSHGAASYGAATFYIGRIGVWDEEHNPVIVDWRAPVAEPFYRATGPEPMGVRRRRHFSSLGRRLLRIEDEYFGDEAGYAFPAHDGASNAISSNAASSDAVSDVDSTTIAQDSTDIRSNPEVQSSPAVRDSAGRVIRGIGAVRQALAEARSGRLSDIVATIQAEQDEVVRSPLPGVLVVQGGPGTGKTVVALHRAAYLLYTHRFPLERQGVLIVAPNRLFANYIEIVLPSLGEAGAVVATPAEMLGLPDVVVEGFDPEAAARVKGDLRMAQLIRRALRDRQRPLRQDFTIVYRPEFSFTVEQSRQLVESIRNRRITHSAGRKLIESGFFSALAEAANLHKGEASDSEFALDSQAVREDIGDTPEVREALEWMWPSLTPAQFLYDLFSVPSLLRSAGRKHFSPEELALLAIPRIPKESSRIPKDSWTMDDVPLLDEARWRLGPPDRKKGRSGRADQIGGDSDDAASRETSSLPPICERTYGHVVIDEAQDATPMQLRMSARRSRNGSMTLVGDIAQATGPLSCDSWEELLEQLPSKWRSRTTELSVGYRLPEPIACYAANLLDDINPDLAMPVAVQREGTPPSVIRADKETLFSQVAAAVKQEAADAATVAVIVPDDKTEATADALRSANIECATAYDGALSTTVSVLPVRYAKGLEVDAAIVLEPSEIINQTAKGTQSLYVALTRAMRRLTVIHTDPLPEALALNSETGQRADCRS